MHNTLSLTPNPWRPLPALLLHRYAAMLGATTELQKAEGLAYDREGNRVFMAISAIEKGMEDFAKRGEENPAYDFGGLRGWGAGARAGAGAPLLDSHP